MELKEKIVLITGGGSGIGRTVSRIFAQEGAIVIAASRSEPNLQSIVKEIQERGGQAFSYKTDISSYDQIKELFSFITRKFGRINTLVNNTGIAGPTEFIRNLEVEDWNQTLSINLTGAMLCSKEALRLMIPQGSGTIVNIAARAGVHGFMLRSPYSVSKAGLINFTQTLAMEVGRYNIRVNCISPGPVESERAKKVIAAKAESLKIPVDDIISEKTEKIALGRFILPEEVAWTAIFLASEKSSGITGQNLIVDGGIVHR